MGALTKGARFLRNSLLDTLLGKADFLGTGDSGDSHDGTQAAEKRKQCEGP